MRVEVVGQVVGRDVRAVGHRLGGELGRGTLEIGVVRDGHAAAEELEAVEVDGEVAHALLHERDREEQEEPEPQGEKRFLQRVHAQEGPAQALHAALGHIHGDDGVLVEVVQLVVGHGALELLDAHDAAALAAGEVGEAALLSARGAGGGGLGVGGLVVCAVLLSECGHG